MRLIQRLPSDRLAYWLIFAACSVTVAALLWSVEYLPMLDVPQYAAQVAVWQNYDDPAFNFRDNYWIDLVTPRLLVFGLLRLAAQVLPMHDAVTFVVVLCVLGVPVTLHLLLAQTSPGSWRPLLGFPLAFGPAFTLGFLNFLVAVPLCIATVALGYATTRRPTVWRFITLSLLEVVLFGCHPFLFGLAAASVTGMLLLAKPARRTVLLTLLSVAVPAALLATWWLKAAVDTASTPEPPWDWDLSIDRLLVPDLLLYRGFDRPAAVAPFQLILIAVMAASIGGLPAGRDACVRAVPLVLATGVYLFAPNYCFGTYFVNIRFAVFLGPFVLFATKPSRLSDLPIFRALLVQCVACWGIILFFHLRHFDQEAVGFSRVLEVLPDNSRLASVTTDELQGLPYVHVPAWYVVRKGGVAELSFANLYTMVARLKPEARMAGIDQDAAGFPHFFELPMCDRFRYVVVQAATDRHRGKLPKGPGTFRLIVHEGRWWLYRYEVHPVAQGERKREADQAHSR